MKLRMPRAVAALALVAASAVACAPTPAPVTTPTTFASEEEAFAAAEETYRAYVDALNQVDLSDPSTFEAVYAWTTGEANAESREGFSEMHAEGLTVSGHTTIDLISPRGGEGVQLDVCLRVAEVTLTNPSGESVVSSRRPDVQSMLVAFEATEGSTSMRINFIDGREDGPRCDS